MKKALLTDDECWLRVQARDASADGRFVFAVRTTGVFCRPSCRSKRALRKNVRFFANAQQALDAGNAGVSGAGGGDEPVSSAPFV